MRLLRLEDDGEFSLAEFVGRNIPRYAILSHTWGVDHEEVTFRDLTEGTGKSKAGYRKLTFCAKRAAHDNLQFFWVDTCCIDKSSSSELTEAINSMFRWYQDASRCYVYLSDVSVNASGGDKCSWRWEPAFKKSRWFTRGWTLQELIAPTSVEFFSEDEKRLGDKQSLEPILREITGIATKALRGGHLPDFSVRERMSWAAKRETKREEDAAYALLGIFDIHMPLIYGEGREKALIRLRKEIGGSLRDEMPARPLALPTERPKRKREPFWIMPPRRYIGFVDQEIPGRASSNLGHRRIGLLPPFRLNLELPYKYYGRLSDRTAQCCFLCLEGRKSKQYAVRIPCFRPTKWRRVICRRVVSNNGAVQSEKCTYEKLNPKENSCESDAAIYHRLKETCFQYQGKWKRWIPFYGVVDVREVKFQFVGFVERDRRFPIHIHPVNTDLVREAADRIIALEPDSFDLNEVCVDENWHSSECQGMMEMCGAPCIKDQVEAARHQKKKLDDLHLFRDCARNPGNANGLRTLEGMAQESCIFDTDQIVVPQDGQPYNRTDELRGMQFVLGWQFDRITYEVPLGVAWTSLGLAVIRLYPIACGGSMGYWGTAVSFGLLLVACVSLLFLHTK